MPAKKRSKRGRAAKAQAVEQEQPEMEDPLQSLPDEPDQNVQPEPQPDVDLGREEVEDGTARRRVATNLSEEEKELVIDFLQQNPALYSKRLAAYKDTAAKERLWTEQARQMNRTVSELKTCT